MKLTATPGYACWANMIQRCHNPKQPRFKDYGKRGIKVCKRWRNGSRFFFEDMGPQPKGMTLDRVNNDLGYSKANCRWADVRTQNRNRPRYIRMITYEGKTMHITDWARSKKIPLATLRERLDRGWTIEQSLSTRPLPAGGWDRTTGKGYFG